MIVYAGFVKFSTDSLGALETSHCLRFFIIYLDYLYKFRGSKPCWSTAFLWEKMLQCMKNLDAKGFKDI